MSSFSLLWRNSLRKPVRFFLTCLSILIAFYLFTVLAGISHALTFSVDGSSQRRLMSQHKISITRSLPLHYQQKIEAMDGVARATYSSWFGGFFRNSEHLLAMTAVASTNYFDVYPEYAIDPIDLDNWKRTRIGLLVGERMAEEYNWKTGDALPLKSSIWMTRDGTFTWDFVVSGIFHAKDANTDTNHAFLQHRYFDEARAYNRDAASWFSTEISPGADSEAIAYAIDQLFENSSMPTRTTTEQVFLKEQAQQFSDMSMVIKVVAAAVFFTLLLIVCNTMIQTVRERIDEIAMMKAIGFSSSYLIRYVYLESLLMFASGAIAGALLAKLSLALVQRQFVEFLPGIALTLGHGVMILSAVLLCALLSTIFPAIRIRNLAISQTLGARR